jgi:mRNA interferase HigB
VPVHVISQKALRDFGGKHADAATPLRAWLKLARHGSFRNLAELKRTFASVDLVPVKGRDFYVFNIGGNKYRLIAAIHFNSQRLFVRHILVHSEYNTERWKK